MTAHAQEFVDIEYKIRGGESRGGANLTFKPRMWEELKGPTVPIVPSRIFDDCQLAT